MEARDPRGASVIPEVFGDLLLVQRLHGRSMSEVFLAVRLGDRSGRPLVVKRPPLGERASGAVAEAIRREAAALGVRRWPGAVVLDAAGDIAGLPYVALEHVRGVTLEDVLQAGALSADAALLLGRDLGRTLAELHAGGYVHGDVAPSNVIIDDAGEIVLADFGLSLKEGEPREGPSGKPGYASPDAALGRPARPSDDVYAWGAVVAECLTGARAFPDRDLAEAAARSAEIPSGAAASPVVARALALEAAARPPTSELASLHAAPAAREELSERALRASAERRRDPVGGEAPRIVAAQAVAPTTVSATAPSPPARRPPGGSAGLGKPVIAGIVAALLASAVLGFVAGRRTMRARYAGGDATLTLPALPARTTVSIDGRTLVVPEPGRPIPLSPGKHTITIGLPRDERDYEVHVEPGDHLLIIPVGKSRKKERE